jgi:hypothetical protein
MLLMFLIIIMLVVALTVAAGMDMSGIAVNHFIHGLGGGGSCRALVDCRSVALGHGDPGVPGEQGIEKVGVCRPRNNHGGAACAKTARAARPVKKRLALARHLGVHNEVDPVNVDPARRNVGRNEHAGLKGTHTPDRFAPRFNRVTTVERNHRVPKAGGSG